MSRPALPSWEEVSCGAGAQGHGPPPPPHSDGCGQTDGAGLSTLSHGPDITLAPGAATSV